LLKELLKTSFTYRSIDAVIACKEFCDWKLAKGLQVKYNDNDRKKVEGWIKRVRTAHSFQVIK